MGKYRLRARKENAVITLMEVDTESHSWYIQADDGAAALRVLQEMTDEISCLVHIYINGKEVGEEVFPSKMDKAVLPEKELEESLAALDGREKEIPWPEDGNPEGFNFPTPDDIQSALATLPPEEKEKKKSISDAYTPIQGLPELTSVLPASAFAVQEKSGPGTSVLIGKGRIKGKLSDMNTIKEEVAGIVIQGTVIDSEIRELHGNRAIFTMKIADETDGVLCKKFFDRMEESKALAGIKKGAVMKVRGNVQLDKYTGGLVLNILQMEKGETVVIPHEDDHPTPRVELHLHTKMSLDGLIDNEEVIKTAAKWKHPAIAITDHGVIQAFPKIQELAAKYKQKVIYGMEGYLIDDIPKDADTDRQRYYHIIILAKNMTGLRNLYRMITLSHIKYYKKRPLLPRPVLEEFREGLIYGSACVVGEFFQAVLQKESEEELVKKAGFYDYLEVQPLENNEFLLYEDRYSDIQTKKDLQDLNKKVIEIGEKTGIPVCATSDAHYLFAEYARSRDILLSNWEKPGKIESHPPVYLRTTREMLNEFNYLPEKKAFEIVVTNTRRIGEQCETIEPLAEEWKSYNPKIAGADEKFEEMCYTKAKEIYGDPLPKIVEDRLALELTPIINHGYGVLYYIAHKLVKHSNDRGYLVGSRGSVGSSFAATMSGITEVNPLPPHYVCPSCRWNHFFTDGSVGGGFDLPDKDCPQCGHALNKDGHDIPFCRLFRI